MYLRTTRRKNKDGSTVVYYQLAHNTRHPQTGNTVAKVLYNFGRADAFEKEDLKRLCRSIARVCDLEVKDKEEFYKNLPEQVGLPKELKQIVTLGLGPVDVIHKLWERLEVGKVLREQAKRKGVKEQYERAVFAMTANRLCEPESKLGVWDRWIEDVYLPSCDGLKLRDMYEAMDLLHESSSKVEEAVFFKTADLLNLEVDLVFYDATTARFSVELEDEDEDGEPGLRKYGHNSEGVWEPQVKVALAVTREGVPVRSWVFPGNTTDVETVKRVKEDLRGWKLGRALFVADGGMNSEQNRRQLSRACGKYLLAVRMSSVAEVKKEVLGKRGRYIDISDNLKAKEVIVGGDGERRRRYILCYNPREAQRQKLHREQVLQILEKELSNHREPKATARWAIQLLASKRYGRYLRVTKSGKVKINTEAVRQAEKYDGKWVLMTNDDTISVEDAARGYKGLMVIERCFRTLKRTQIKMSPMYHWLPRRIEAHVKICVLALLMERVCELSCKRPWWQIKRDLSKLQATKYRTEKFEFFQTNEPTREVREIYKKLDISMPNRVLSVSPLS